MKNSLIPATSWASNPDQPRPFGRYSAAAFFTCWRGQRKTVMSGCKVKIKFARFLKQGFELGCQGKVFHGANESQSDPKLDPNLLDSWKFFDRLKEKNRQSENKYSIDTYELSVIGKGKLYTFWTSSISRVTSSIQDPLGRIQKAEKIENWKAEKLTGRPNKQKTVRPNFNISSNNSNWSIRPYWVVFVANKNFDILGGN